MEHFSEAQRAPHRAAAIVRVSRRGVAGVSAAVLRRRAGKMLAHLGLGGVELSIALVDDAAIRELNRVYRRKDKATDVLAFPMSSERAARRAPGELLGDVIVSIDTAGRQAKRRRRPLLDEVTMLLAHGLLHLLGHDHRTDREERAMTAATTALERAAASRSPARPRVPAGG